MPTRPIVNAGLMYINGMNLVHVDDENITVVAGACRDHTNTNDITLPANLNVDLTTNGAGGLDIGVLVLDTWYAVYAIGSSYNQADPSAIVSADLTQPYLPEGYDMYRRIGYVKTDGDVDLLAFTQRGKSSDRTMWWDAAIATDITAGTSAAYADVTCTAGAPLQATELVLLVAFTPTGADDTVHLKPKGSASVGGYAIMSGSAAGVAKTGMMVCPCSAAALMQYKVTGTATAISVQAYVDQL